MRLSRDTALLCAVGATSAMSAVALAAPATAEVEDYLPNLQPKYVYLSSQQLMNLGHRACAIVGSGQSGAVAAIALEREAGLEAPVAFDIVKNAVLHLGC